MISSMVRLHPMQIRSTNLQFRVQGDGCMNDTGIVRDKGDSIVVGFGYSFHDKEPPQVYTYRGENYLMKRQVPLQSAAVFRTAFEYEIPTGERWTVRAKEYESVMDASRAYRKAEHELVLCIRFGKGEGKSELEHACRIAETAYWNARAEFEKKWGPM
jgi:hypothetical protein